MGTKRNWMEGEKMNDEYNYDDMINLPHPVSKKHPQMPLYDRAAQFSPFAALTGHEEAIRETARQTEAWVDLDEDRKEELNEKMQEIVEHLNEAPEVTLTYFKEDEKKEGGSYVTVTGRIKKWREYEQQLVLEDGTVVALEKVFGIE